MDICATVRVKPWGQDQGDFVEINAEDFDPKIHTAFDAPAEPKASPKPRTKKGAKK